MLKEEEESVMSVNMLMNRQMEKDTDFKFYPDSKFRLLKQCFRKPNSNSTNMIRARENLETEEEKRAVAWRLCFEVVEDLTRSSVKRVLNRQKRVKKKQNFRLLRSLINGTFCQSTFQKGIRKIKTNHDCVQKCWQGERQEDGRRRIRWRIPLQDEHGEGGDEEEKPDGDSGEEKTLRESEEGGVKTRGRVPDAENGQRYEGDEEGDKENDQEVEGGVRGGARRQDQVGGHVSQEERVCSAQREGCQRGTLGSAGCAGGCVSGEGCSGSPVSDRRGQETTDRDAGRGQQDPQIPPSGGGAVVSHNTYRESQDAFVNVSIWSHMLILELIDYVTEFSLDMPEKSKNTKSPAKEAAKEDVSDDALTEEGRAEKGEKVKPKPKKFSQKDEELLVENLEGIPSEQFWNSDQLRRVRNDEEVSVEIGVAIHPDFHQSDSETGQETDTESVLDEGSLDRILVVSPPGKHPKKINGKMVPPANYLKKNISVVTMKKKAVFNAVRAGAKAPKYKCEVPECSFSCNLKKEFTAHTKSCHDGVHVDVTKEGRNRTRVCIAEVAGAVKPKFLIDKNNKLKGWVETNATLIKMNLDKEKTTPGRLPMVQTVSRKSASQPTQTQTESPSIGSFSSQDWQAPIGNRNGTPIPPGVLGSNNQTPKRKVVTRYSEADDSIMVEKGAKKDKIEKEKSPDVQSDNLSDLSSLTTNRTPNSSINLLENIQTSTLRPGDAQRLLNYSEDELDETIIRRTQTQSQSQESRAVAAEDIDMIEKDMMRAKINSLEENVAIVQSKNDALEEENIGLLYYKMKAKDWIEDRDKMIALMKSKKPVPDELNSQVMSQGEEMRCEEVGTQSDINMAEMRRLAWMDRDEEERVKEVGVLHKRLERSETMNSKYIEKVKELREENMRLEKNRDDLKKRCDQDGDVILSLTVSVRSLEMVNKDQAHKIKDLDRKIPCKKVECKGPKECNRSHEFKTGVFAPPKKTLCTFFLKNECYRGSKCKWSHEIAKHPLEKVRDQVIRIQGNGPDSEGASNEERVVPEDMDQDNSARVEDAVEEDVVVSLEEQLEPVSQAPLPSPSSQPEDQAEPSMRGVNNGGARPKDVNRSRGVRPRRPSSSDIRNVQFGRGRGFDHGKALRTQEYYVNNIKNRGRSRERGVSPSPRKGQPGQRSRGSSSASFVSAKSSLSSRNSSLSRSQDRRTTSQPRRIAPPRPRTPERTRSVGDVRPRGRLPPRRPPSDNEIGKWYRQEMEKEEEKERRRRDRSIPNQVASREDLRVMSDDGIRYVQERLVSLSQSGNGFGQRFPRSSGPNTFRGNNEELRDRAVDRLNTRTSNRAHFGEVYNMAAGNMRERMERSLYGRR